MASVIARYGRFTYVRTLTPGYETELLRTVIKGYSEETRSRITIGVLVCNKEGASHEGAVEVLVELLLYRFCFTLYVVRSASSGSTTAVLNTR